MSRLTSLRNEEFSDRELLALMIDLRDASGVVTSQQIAEALDPDAASPVQCVGIRLGWMRRYGVVEWASDGVLGWQLTDKGERVANGQLKAAQQQALESLGPEQGLDAALMLGSLYRRLEYTEATMLRRGWQHGSGRKNG